MVSLSMVQKTTDKFADQRLLFNSRNVTNPSDKLYPFAINRMSLRESPNESVTAMKSPVSSAQPKEAEINSDSANLVGNKRQQSLATNGSTGHLVYVRRKLETEHGKTNTASNGDITCTPGSKKFSIEASTITETQKEETAKPEEEQNKDADTQASRHIETQDNGLRFSITDSYWTERFNRLQDLLQYLDKSGSIDYAEKFRNFSVEDLNKHAIELEKRAIHLSLEEALQSKRVKELNLLGKSSQ